MDAYNILLNWKQDPHNLFQILGASSDGIAFTNVGERGTKLATISKEKEKVWEKSPPIETIKCYAECNKMGHYSNQCPEKTGIQLLMAGVESDEFYDDVSIPDDVIHSIDVPSTEKCCQRAESCLTTNRRSTSFATRACSRISVKSRK
jgi:hypothetical protein